MTARMRYRPGTPNADRWPGWVPVETVELAHEIAVRSPNTWDIEPDAPGVDGDIARLETGRGDVS